MSKLNDKYVDLLIEVWETKIPVVDASRPYPDVLRRPSSVRHCRLLQEPTVVLLESLQPGCVDE